MSPNDRSAEHKALMAKIERLRRLRLAREAVDLTASASPKRPATRKPAKKKPVSLAVTR